MTMPQQLDEKVEQRINKIKIAVDDYNDTIHAIIGFVNLYLLDDKTYQPRLNVKGFQGRRLTPLPASKQPTKRSVERDVCPDLGIVIEGNRGILGEVKKNFPEEVERAEKEFTQLKKYDQELMGWPVVNQQVQSHEIVLLVHLTTSVYAEEFYKEGLPKTGIIFQRPFSIVEFGRVPQKDEFFFLRTVLGEPTEIGDKKGLKYGVKVPMRVLLHDYAKVKLYDAEPPIPYLVELIWVNVVLPIASESPKFEHLRRKQKFEVTITIEDIVERLDEGFSFHFWHWQNPDRQPRIPHAEWVREACQSLIESGEAEWVEGSEESQLLIFYQIYDDVKKHFELSYATIEEEKELKPMFPGFESTESKPVLPGFESTDVNEEC